MHLDSLQLGLSWSVSVIGHRLVGAIQQGCGTRVTAYVWTKRQTCGSACTYLTIAVIHRRFEHQRPVGCNSYIAAYEQLHCPLRSQLLSVILSGSRTITEAGRKKKASNCMLQRSGRCTSASTQLYRFRLQLLGHSLLAPCKQAVSAAVPAWLFDLCNRACV